MFDFIKNIFKKEPQEEQIVEVDVKPKRKYKPRTPKTEVNVVEATQPAVIAQALAEPIRPRIVTKQLVGSATPAPVAEEAVEPVVEVTKKAPVKKKPVAKKPSETVVEIAGQESKAMADQITTVAKERLTSCLGQLSRNDMKALEQAVKIQLHLPL